MSDQPKAHLTIMAIHRLTSRQLAMVSGALDGEPVRIGDRAVIRSSGAPTIETSVRTIEMHSPAGMTTFGLDEILADGMSVGDVLSFY